MCLGDASMSTPVCNSQDFSFVATWPGWVTGRVNMYNYCTGDSQSLGKSDWRILVLAFYPYCISDSVFSVSLLLLCRYMARMPRRLLFSFAEFIFSCAVSPPTPQAYGIHWEFGIVSPLISYLTALRAAIIICVRVGCFVFGISCSCSCLVSH